jgi:SAM-dependent methyltransferase
MRSLHIGPGRDKLPGFDTLDIRPGYDIQADAAGPLPIANDTYDLIYASHIIEHIPWWKTVDTLKEWLRILKPGGSLEIWTVNAAKVARQLLENEDNFSNWIPDNWRRHNPGRNPYLWSAGRIFAYGEDAADPNWHKALFTPKHLSACLYEAGFSAGVEELDRREVRGKDHGWINLGLRAVKASD